MLNLSVCAWLRARTRVCVGQGAIFTVVVFNAVFFRIQSLTPNHFLAKQIEFGRIFSSTTFLTRIFSYSILKLNLCTSRRTQLQQKVEMSVSFVILS